MDTAKMKTLQQVIDAIGAIQQALQDPQLSNSERTALESTKVALRGLQNDIIINSEQGLIDALQGKSKELNDLADQINKESGKLDALAATVKKVADVIGTLVNITAAAVSAGLI